MMKTEVPGIYKASEGVLINKDDEGLRAYKAHRNKELRIVNMEQELQVIKKDMEEIKMLLKELVR